MFILERYQLATSFHNSLVFSIIIKQVGQWIDTLLTKPSESALTFKGCSEWGCSAVLDGAFCRKDYGISDGWTEKGTLAWKKAVLDTCLCSQIYVCSFPTRCPSHLQLCNVKYQQALISHLGRPWNFCASFLVSMEKYRNYVLEFFSWKNMEWSSISMNVLGKKA